MFILNNLFIVLLLVSIIALPVLIIMSVIAFTKKDSSKGKKMLKFSGISLIATIVMGIGVGITTDPAETIDEKKVETVAKAEETVEEKAIREEKKAEEKALAEQKAKEETEAKAKAEEAARIKAEEEAKAKEQALKLNGTGDTVTSKFSLENGFVIINATHQGSRNFAVKLLDANANSVELVVNEIGNYNGSKVYSVSAGEYLYEVTAGGSWSINMSQEIPENVSPEGTVSGKGDSVVFMEISAGAKTVSFTHDGQSNFAVKANDSVLLANEIGSYKGSKVQKINDNSIYFFDITADGNWTMTFE